MGAFWGPFVTGEAVEGVLVRVRRSLPWRRRRRQPADELRTLDSLGRRV